MSTIHATGAASSVELEPTSTSQIRNDTDWQTTTAPSDVSNIVEASRIYDASVPDGGYGWVIVGVCSVLCFWFGRWSPLLHCAHLARPMLISSSRHNVQLGRDTSSTNRKERRIPNHPNLRRLARSRMQRSFRSP